MHRPMCDVTSILCFHSEGTFHVVVIKGLRQDAQHNYTCDPIIGLVFQAQVDGVHENRNVLF